MYIAQFAKNLFNSIWKKDNVLKCVSYKVLQKAISALDPSSIGELRWWEGEGYIATKPLLPIAPLGAERDL